MKFRHTSIIHVPKDLTKIGIKPEPDQNGDQRGKLIDALDNKNPCSRIAATRGLSLIAVFELGQPNDITRRLLSLFEHLVSFSPFDDVRQESIDALYLLRETRRLRILKFREGCESLCSYRDEKLRMLQHDMQHSH